MQSILNSLHGVRYRFGAAYGRSASVISFNHDGLELARVKTRRSRHLPIWHLVFFVYVAMVIRLIAMAESGPLAYSYRMDELRQGSMLERMTAHVMYMDPVSRSIAVEIRAGLRKFGVI